jgi:hypothetical protein
MDTWLNASSGDGSNDEPVAAPTEDTETVEEDASAKQKAAVKSATTAASVKAPSNTKAIADEFNDLFNS